MTELGLTRHARIDWKGFFLVFGLSLVFLVALTIWIDNTNAITGNGLWKLATVVAWRDAPGLAATEPANALYFPLVGTLIRGAALIWPGNPWTSVGMVSAAFFALATASCYQTVLILTAKRSAALGAALCHTFFAFPLLLSISSEDIAPGYAFFTLAVLGIALTAQGKKSLLWAALTGVAFSMSWLQHWTLLLPSILPLLAALLWCSHEQKRPFWQLTVAFLAGAALFPVLVGTFTPLKLSTLLWPGKGLGSGWAGWTLNKFFYTFAAIAHYQFFGLNGPSFETLLQWPYVFGLVLGLAVFGALLFFLWKNRAQWKSSPSISATLITGLGTFGCGEVMNLYSQPQDPQMQIQPLYWMALALGLFLATGQSEDQMNKKRITWMGAYLLLLLVINGWQTLGYRGGDSQYVSIVKQIENASPPAKTLLLEHSFSLVNAWTFVLWPTSERHVWPIGSQWISNPKWSNQQVIDDTLNAMSKATREGQQIMAGPIWGQSEAEFVGSFATVVGPEKSGPLYRALHSSYDAAPWLQTAAGPYFRLTRHQK